MYGKNPHKSPDFPGRYSNWQNVYHHLDTSPAPKPEVVSLGLVLGQLAMDAGDQPESSRFRVEELKEVTTFQNRDKLEGILVRFTARSPKDPSAVIEVETKVMPSWPLEGKTFGMPPSTIRYKIGSVRHS